MLNVVSFAGNMRNAVWYTCGSNCSRRLSHTGPKEREPTQTYKFVPDFMPREDLEHANELIRKTFGKVPKIILTAAVFSQLSLHNKRSPPLTSPQKIVSTPSLIRLMYRCRWMSSSSVSAHALFQGSFQPGSLNSHHPSLSRGIGAAAACRESH
jgi:hypothetical protein